MRILVTGANGQVGRGLLDSKPAGHTVVGLARAELDITDAAQVDAAVARLRPDVVINAAAYTAVDRAEIEADRAFAINVTGVRNLAASAGRSGARLIHLSTDFVFDGAAGRPYATDATPRPLSVYGRTKLEGEQAALSLAGNAVIVRTAWVYSAHGRNFMTTMLRLMREGGVVRVVADQVGTPTSVYSLVRVLWRLTELRDVSGLQHWTDAGVASWYDFATAIGEEAVSLGLIVSALIEPIATPAYPTPAARPAYGVLDKALTIAATGCVPLHWRKELRRVLQDVSPG